MRIAGWIKAVVAGLGLVICQAQAQAAARSFVHGGVPYWVDVWETDDGLPQGAVLTMVQSRDGYLWLGTLSGLVRFDGLQFEVFDESNTPGLNSGWVVCLFEDGEGHLWLGTETAGVAVIADGQVHALPVPLPGAERRLAAACQDATGTVWLYTANGELWRCGRDRTNSFLVERGLPSLCRSMIAESNGRVWVGTDWSLSALAPVPDAGSLDLPVQTNLSVRQLDLLLASRQGGFWCLAEGHILKWTTNGLVDFGTYPWGPVRPSAACEDGEGNLIVGTLGAGLFWFDVTGQPTQVSTNQGLSYNYILSLLMDREGNLWVGTDGGGLNRIKRQAFQTLEPTAGRVVQSVSPHPAGGLWIGFNAIGPEAVGLMYWSNGWIQPFGPRDGLLSPSVRAVHVDSAGQVWVGTWGRRGAGLFHFQAGRLRWVADPELRNREISVIYQDRRGELWLGTVSGLVRWREPHCQVFTTREGLSADDVRALAEDSQGGLWIGTRGGGLNYLRDGVFTVVRKQPDGLPSDEIASLWMDAEGVLWIGTFGSGLARWQAGRWTRYTTREGLADNNIGYLLEDDQGNLWIGSSAGLMRVAKADLNALAQGQKRTLAVRTYDKADGLPTRECTRGSQPGPCRTSDGRLWFPTTKGLASVNPTQLQPNTNPPPVLIRAVLVDGHLQNTNPLQTRPLGTLIIPPGKERLEVHYVSLNLGAPDRARFKYRLEGHETAWTEVGNLRVARYSKLPPGQYRFQVTACNEDGLWNPTGTTLAITVQPPVWRRWWFLTAATAAVLGVVVALVHYLSTQKLHRQLEALRQKEALERDRARIARDIHDQLGASLTQMSLLGELIEADRHAPDEVAAHARQLSQTARDTTRVLDEIVWTVNPANDTLEGLVNYICKYAQDYLAVAGLRCRLELPAQVPAADIPPDVRHNVFLAAKEAITNVVRHAAASAVWVRLELEPAAFTLEIRDNGRGLPSATAPASGTRNGLRNMQRRMEDVGGQFWIGPGPTGGTAVRLTVPLRQARRC
jgi:signal transduction histidine kinase/ligand-binding sensor domain-containing protein